MTDKKNSENIQSSKETEQGSSSKRFLNVGRQLQSRRRALKLSIAQMSEQTRIRQETLKNMEANKFAEIQEPVYTRGFLRTYADHLGLDGEELVQLLEKQNQLPEDKEISLPTPADEGVLPSRKTLLITALFLLIIGGVWYNNGLLKASFTESFTNQSDMQPNSAVPAPEDDTDNKDASDIIPSPAFQTPQAVKFSNAEKNNQEDAQIQTAPKKPAPQEEAAADLVPKAPDGARIRLYAKDDVWFEVKPKGADSPVFSKVLAAQSSYWVPVRDDLLLDVGLPPALVVFVDGQRMGISGMIDRRVRDLPLRPVYLKEDYFGQNVHLEPNIPQNESNADTNQNKEPATNTLPKASGETSDKASNNDIEDVVVDDQKFMIRDGDEAE